MQEVISGTLTLRWEGADWLVVLGLGKKKFGEDRGRGVGSKPNVVLGIMRPVEQGWAIDHTGAIHPYSAALSLILSRATFVAPW